MKRTTTLDTLVSCLTSAGGVGKGTSVKLEAAQSAVTTPSDLTHAQCIMQSYADKALCMVAICKDFAISNIKQSNAYKDKSV